MFQRSDPIRRWKSNLKSEDVVTCSVTNKKYVLDDIRFISTNGPELNWDFQRQICYFVGVSYQCAVLVNLGQVEIQFDIRGR